MDVYINNTEHIVYQSGMPIQRLRCADDIVIAIDPSKSNMAMLFGNEYGDVYSIVEFSGNGRKKGRAMDTTIFCKEVQDFLIDYIGDTKVYYVGIEQAIGKKGMNEYHSSMVLTEIRATLLNFFLRQYNIRTTEINNWSWKHAILPQGYRSMFEKGSKRYFIENFPDNPICNYFEADATDVMCIFMYIQQILPKRISRCSAREKALHPIQIFIGMDYLDNYPDVTEFEFNPMFTVEENVNYVSNRLTKPGIAKVPVEYLTISDIYKYATGFDNINTTEVRLLVRRS